jgi:hypothetical protein
MTLLSEEESPLSSFFRIRKKHLEARVEMQMPDPPCVGNYLQVSGRIEILLFTLTLQLLIPYSPFLLPSH